MNFPRSRSWFHLSLRRQLFIALGLLIALLLIVLAVAVSSLTYMRAVTRHAVEVDGQMSYLANEIANQTLLCRRYEANIFLNVAEPSMRGYYFIMWKGAHQNLDIAVSAFAAAAATPEDQQQAREWIAQNKHYASAITAIEAAVTAGTITTPQSIQAAFRSSEEPIRQFTTTALTVAQRKSAAARDSQAALEASVDRAIRVLVLTGIITALTSALTLWLFPNWLMRPIAALDTAARRLANGDESVRVTTERTDELGALAQSFNHMVSLIEQRTQERAAQYTTLERAHATAEAARAESAARLTTIEQQQTIIREMTVPVLALSSSILLMPLIGALDTARLSLVQRQALHALERSTAQRLILDITGVPTIDEAVARGIIQVVDAARLLGVKTVVVGIRPEVAQVLVALGIDLSRLATHTSLQDSFNVMLGSAR